MSGRDRHDPMWATFHREHPEVTLVLLPDVPHAGEGDGGSAAHGRSTAPEATVEQATGALDALMRRIGMLAEVLHLDQPPREGWRAVDRETVEPQASLRAPATEGTPTDRDVIAMRLEQLGWKPEVRAESQVVWVDAVAGDEFVRVTVIDGVVAIRSTGARLYVGREAAESLRGATHG